MKKQPTLETKRLRLRRFTLADAADVQRLAGDRDVASTMMIPHPYEVGMAEHWVSTHLEGFNRGELATFAITLRESAVLVGAISLTIRRKHSRGELGYWIGKPYWNRGYCTEAAKAILQFGFVELGLNRIHASHFTRNPASGRVMQKIGMTYEGRLRQHVEKWGVFEDLDLYGILPGEFFGEGDGGDSKSLRKG